MARPIPLEALTRHLAILGTTGSGKTTAAKSGIVEPLLEAKSRVLVIDPTAAWWGLRLAANGKGAGFPIYIFGGDHGDYPLRAKDAATLADAFATSSDSAIFDTSLMTVTERSTFFIDFATTLMRRNRGPINLVIDEAHLFMPQVGAKAGGMVPAMLHAGNNLVSLGRSKGIRVAMISQRPAKLHKDSLTQAQSLIAMRVLHPLDRRAITDWIDEQGDPKKGAELVASLTSLKAGEAWVWCPLLAVLDRVRFPMPKTFDSSRAPDETTGPGPVLGPINLDALKGKLATIEAETKANDPNMLRAEIARLKSEVSRLAFANQAAKRDAPDPRAIEEAERRGWTDGYKLGRIAGINFALDKIEHLKRHGTAVIEAARTADAELTRSRDDPPSQPMPRPQANPKQTPIRQPLAAAAKSTLTNPRSMGGTGVAFPDESQTISPSARKIIDAIHRAYPVTLSFDAAARRAAVSKRSSAYRSYKAEVHSCTELEAVGDRFRSLPEFAQGGGIDAAATLDQWVARLPPAYGAMLRAVAAGGAPDKDDIAQRSGVSRTSSGLGSGLRELMALSLIEHDPEGSTYRLAEGL